MIELPNFDEQSRYDYETHFHLTLELSRLAKFVAHYEAFKAVNELPGAIVECGVFKGTSLARFAMFRELLGNNFSSKIIAFDVFSDEFPNTRYNSPLGVSTMVGDMELSMRFPGSMALAVLPIKP